METLDDVTWDAAALAAAYPVRFSHPNKHRVHQIADGPATGPLRMRRWATRPPDRIAGIHRLQVTEFDGPFAYDDTDRTDVMVFYPNFADPDLFAYWNGPLLAQDELQVAEHPILGSVRQALVDEDRSTRTVQGRQPTPFTFEGVERRCAIDVAHGLYGNRFSSADAEAVDAATTPIDPPTRTHLVAMASLYGGRDRYTSEEVDWLLTAAHTAFRGARTCAVPRHVLLHTGFWGCGAFGGNHTMMALIQLVAAASAGIEEVVFHTFSEGGRQHLADALDHLKDLDARLGDHPTDWGIAITGLGLCWGVGDGN